MTAVATLSRLLLRHRCSMPRVELGSGGDIALLIRLGLAAVEQSGSTVLCNACDFDHAAAVVMHPVSGQIGWSCPEVGFVPAEEANLELVRAKPDQLVALLADALGCRRRRGSPLIENTLWRVGAFDFEEQDITVYLALDLSDAAKADEVASALLLEAGLRRGLILTPGLSGNPGFSISRCAIAALADLVDLDANGLIAEHRHAAALAGVQERQMGGRPPHPRKAAAEALIRERQTSGEASETIRAEAKAVAKIMGEGAPGPTTLSALIREVRSAATRLTSGCRESPLID